MLHAIQQHQVVIGAQCAEFGRHLVHAFAELVEGVHLAWKLGIIQLEIGKLNDLAISGPWLRLGLVSSTRTRHRCGCAPR